MLLMLGFTHLNVDEINFIPVVSKENKMHIQSGQKIGVFFLLKYLKVLLTFIVWTQRS